MKKTIWMVLVCCLLTQMAIAETPAEPSQAAELAVQGPVQVGDVLRLSFRSEPFVPPKALARPTLAWRQEIYMPGASYVAPHFSHFDLPDGAELVVRAPDRSRSWTYTGYGKADHYLENGFWGIHIPGEVAVVEIFSRTPVAANAVVIDSFAHGYPEVDLGFLKSGFDTEAICGVDDSDWAQCYTASEPVVYDKAQAVARLLIGGTSACTGWLVGDEGHVMTNNHCIGSSSSALNTDYEFVAEGSCGQNCASFGACPGTVEATSGTLIQTDSTLDYSLILLPTNVTGTYGFLQMRSSGAVVDERIYIPGHPGAWGKRISVESSHSSDPSGFCEVFSLNEPPCTGGGGNDVGYFCDTQGGSSGSPVLGYGDHAVVSLHHCANCPNRGLPIEAVISDLGSNLPNNSVVGGGPPPPPPPPPTCAPKGASCTIDAECCSNKCKGKPGAMTCK